MRRFLLICLAVAVVAGFAAKASFETVQVATEKRDAQIMKALGVELQK